LSEDENDNSELECKVCLNEIKDKKHSSREELKQYITEWCTKKKFKLGFNTQEREKGDGTKISTLYCSEKKFDCPFFLQFKMGGEGSADEVSNFYVLESYKNIHNHSVFKYDGASSFTSQMYEKLRELMSVTQDCSSLTDSINKEFRTKFQRRTVYYQVRKIREENIGKPSQDASNLLKLLKDESDLRNGFYEADIQNNQLRSVCFMSNRMKHMLKYFSDVLVLDITHKMNRFNLPCLDVALINNIGKTCICFFALMKDQKEDTLTWALQKLQSQMDTDPKVIFTDDDSALTNGIYYCYF